ncbi:Zinc finger, RING-type [Sesbania bispinosa]|nr:Zinc finger, RING-type [Sesbania bispinosa]
MGEVAVMHSEPLQFECNDMKHVTEKDVYNLPSNEEHIVGEKSSQPTDHIKIEDLQERGYMEYGCQHYRRRCQIRAPCCNEIFDCRHCHNDAKNNINIDQKHRHDIPRHQIKQVICSLCGTEQEVQQNCINCGVCMGKYFCETCKLFDDDVSKQQYHCNGCGICRTGGCENFFHCYKCGCCYSTLLKNSHLCVEGAMHHDCPVCFEYLFESLNEVTVLLCGHTIHKSCLKEMREHFQYACPLCSKSVCDMSKVWEKFDLEIAATPMPEPYLNKMVSQYSFFPVMMTSIVCQHANHATDIVLVLLMSFCGYAIEEIDFYCELNAKEGDSKELTVIVSGRFGSFAMIVAKLLMSSSILLLKSA